MTGEKPRHPLHRVKIHPNNHVVLTGKLPFATRAFRKLQLTYRRPILTFLSRLSPFSPNERLGSRRCFPLGGADPDARKDAGAPPANQDPGRLLNPAYMMES